jgi:hypothetical protein
MKLLRTSLNLLVVIVIFAGIAHSQPASLKGVWQVSEVTTTGPTAATTSSPQPGLYIFTGKYYSAVVVTGDTPRPDLSEKPTDAELLAAYTPFRGQSGTYEVSGTTVTLHPMVAKAPNVMHPDSVFTYSFKWEGKTLALTGISTQAGPTTNPTTIKLSRLE